MVEKIKKKLIKILCNLIPIKSWRVGLRNKLLDVNPINTIETTYGLIYLPIYNTYCPPDGHPPEIYNKDRQRMEVFFLRDFHCAHEPYMVGDSKHILWDRYNFGLKTHFYTHKCVLETIGNPTKKYAWFMESEAIVPEDYKIFDKNKGLDKEFELIFTHSEKLLNKYSNARFLASCAKPWYGSKLGGGVLSEEAYKYKTKNISMVSSYKTMCNLHTARIELAKKLKVGNKVDTFGDFDGGKYINIADSLSDYRYSIAFENEITPYWFTEKITNCFASMTVPIYLGALKIDDFFNPDGIIKIKLSDIDDIEKVLSMCNEKDYEQRLEAIKDNYNRVQKYIVPVSDVLYEDYLKDVFK